MKVMIVVTHLLGTGHLSRALTLARAFAAAGHDARVVSGGMAAPQLDISGLGLIQLPPLRSDGTDFTRLLTGSGAAADTAYLAGRQSALLSAFAAFAPDILITELFPFGRRVLRAEFTALLEAAATTSPRPVVLASIRDILAPPSKPERADAAAALVAAHYDAVLVHSDPLVTRLETSWPVPPGLAAKLRYTGYVAPPPAAPHPEGAGKGEIIVTAGGGPVGLPVFRAAIEAAGRIADRRWRLLVGGSGAGARIADLAASAGDAPVTVEPARRDFRAMLLHAAASVSMCGYNTAMDLLQAGTPAVLIPFDEGNEVEQGLRAQSLARRPGLAVLPSAALTGAALAQAVQRVITTPRAPSALDFDGAAGSVSIAEQLAGMRR